MFHKDTAKIKSLYLFINVALKAAFFTTLYPKATIYPWFKNFLFVIDQMILFKGYANRSYQPYD